MDKIYFYIDFHLRAHLCLQSAGQIELKQKVSVFIRLKSQSLKFRVVTAAENGNEKSQKQ